MLLLNLGLLAQELPQTQHIYNTVRYEILDHQFNKGKQVSLTNLLTGTCWVTSVGGEVVVITAAHNLALPPHFRLAKVGSYDFDPSQRKHSFLKAVEIAPVVGLLAHEIKEVGVLREDLDCVLLRSVQKEVLSGSRCIPLASVPVKTGDAVTVSGYPGTAMEQSEPSMVVSIALNGQFMALEKPLDPGYSGGVVFNSKKEAVGLIVTTEKKQAMALILSEPLLRQVRWQPLSVLKRQTF